MNNLKDILREILVDVKGYVNVYNLLDNCINWPNAIPPADLDLDEDWIDEPQDLENYEILSITDDKIIICCGGDWQEPMTIEIESFNGVLTVTSAEATDYDDGMSNEDILEILKTK